MGLSGMCPAQSGSHHLRMFLLRRGVVYGPEFSHSHFGDGREENLLVSP